MAEDFDAADVVANRDVFSNYRCKSITWGTPHPGDVAEATSLRQVAEQKDVHKPCCACHGLGVVKNSAADSLHAVHSMSCKGMVAMQSNKHG